MNQNPPDPVFPYTASLLLMLGRILIALPFLASAFGQLGNFSGYCGVLRDFGVPLPSVFCGAVIAFAAAGSFSMVLGYRTRSGAAMLSAVTFFTALVINLAPDQTMNLLRNGAIMGGLVTFMAIGPGELSLDASVRTMQHKGEKPGLMGRNSEV
ncbi:MAG: DoxX family protein [bacterium]